MSNTMIKEIAVFYDIYLNKSSVNFRPIPCAKFFTISNLNHSVRTRTSLRKIYLKLPLPSIFDNN